CARDGYSYGKGFDYW
nr:immunoglobulin heavy chain junction region [Macaca mulatta]MOV86945.1 immunoglobulin heavy chain junction region [Macaca mulatta]MOV87032.1 immunoglobulin heavy chain junction region [Macaca mulatta]MOV87434.1 immunoglobulin heavy chain junction region [Macaca mulatta]MOV87848.1 immunoglobulin heavy chain junction region [Macaca mulatta]